MKTRKLDKKLRLNKETITRLNNNEMKNAKAGVKGTVGDTTVICILSKLLGCKPTG